MPITLATIADFPLPTSFSDASAADQQKVLNAAVARLHPYGIDADSDLETHEAAALANIVVSLWVNPDANIDLGTFAVRTLGVDRRVQPGSFSLGGVSADAQGGASSGGAGVDQTARAAAQAAQNAADAAANAARQNANKLMPPSEAEARAGAATAIRGWTAKLIRAAVDGAHAAGAVFPDINADGFVRTLQGRKSGLDAPIYFWSRPNYVPDTPGEASGVGKVLTVDGEGDTDYSWKTIGENQIDDAVSEYLRLNPPPGRQDGTARRAAAAADAKAVAAQATANQADTKADTNTASITALGPRLLPAPSAADDGKVAAVKADGSGYELVDQAAGGGEGAGIDATARRAAAAADAKAVAAQATANENKAAIASLPTSAAVDTAIANAAIELTMSPASFPPGAAVGRTYEMSLTTVPNAFAGNKVRVKIEGLVVLNQAYTPAERFHHLQFEITGSNLDNLRTNSQHVEGNSLLVEVEILAAGDVLVGRVAKAFPVAPVPQNDTLARLAGLTHTEITPGVIEYTDIDNLNTQIRNGFILKFSDRSLLPADVWVSAKVGGTVRTGAFNARLSTLRDGRDTISFNLGGTVEQTKPIATDADRLSYVQIEVQFHATSDASKIDTTQIYRMPVVKVPAASSGTTAPVASALPVLPDADVTENSAAILAMSSSHIGRIYKFTVSGRYNIDDRIGKDGDRIWFLITPGFNTAGTIRFARTGRTPAAGHAYTNTGRRALTSSPYLDNIPNNPIFYGTLLKRSGSWDLFMGLV